MRGGMAFGAILRRWRDGEDRAGECGVGVREQRGAGTIWLSYDLTEDSHGGGLDVRPARNLSSSWAP